MQDVNLSGGDLGGIVVDGTEWPMGEERSFALEVNDDSGARSVVSPGPYLYRRDYADLAVYTGRSD